MTTFDATNSSSAVLLPASSKALARASWSFKLINQQTMYKKKINNHDNDLKTSDLIQDGDMVISSSSQ
ncbi:MAG: hypothetical protein IPO25_08740 [Saprospiraceae bacterium]|nr:hypothetical protein [Saprospiraceae bacterium]